MQRLEVSGAVRPIYGSLGVKRLIPTNLNQQGCTRSRQQELGILGTISVFASEHKETKANLCRYG